MAKGSEEQQVWAEPGGGRGARWRQSASEVRLIATRVPEDCPPSRLRVELETHSVKVWDAVSGEVYLHGRLHRGISLQDSVWTHGGGRGEEGCLLLMAKKNLELLQDHSQHSEMWWPRLFEDDEDIAWDDYEKDYSDLPPEIMDAYRMEEARRRMKSNAGGTADDGHGGEAGS